LLGQAQDRNNVRSETNRRAIEMAQEKTRREHEAEKEDEKLRRETLHNLSVE